MKRYKITVAYDGTNYSGWQIQANGVTVQEKLQKAVHKVTDETVTVHGSGRTDQGVHARKQVAHFDLESEFPVKSLRRALNSALPDDIRIMAAVTASPTFHARKDVKSKEYRYFIWNADVMIPDMRNHKVHVWNKLDVAAMREAAAHLEGRHDFAAFTANPNRVVESTVRDLTMLKVIRKGHEIVIVARSSGFLFRMVRSLAGFLIRVGEGAVPAKDARTILSSRLRTARVPTAPAKGLFLWNVTY
jgi:tRNA pseudouridine38-40 synthase